MIDLRLLRENPDLVRLSQQMRGDSVDLVDDLLRADEARRSAISSFEALRAEQKQLGKLMPKATGEEKSALLAQTKELADRVKTAEAAVTQAEAALRAAHLAIPNLVQEGAPAGGEDDYQVLREVGGRPSIDDPKDHLEIAEGLRAIDMERGAKVSGSRFYFLKGVGARLELALIQMGLDRALAAGFEPLITPTLVRPEIMAGTGFLGAHADEIYYLERDDLYLTGTSEVALAGYHRDEIIDVTSPVRYAGISTCYRREAGSGGKDTRGIIRVHQFQKLEMFSYCDPKDAEAEHEALLAMEEGMLRDLGLAYRVIDVAAGDLGSSAARKFDTEAWVPTQGAFRELTSTSNCTTYQARRLDIRYRAEEGGKTAHVATLNGTLATTRWIVALLETHQQPDGSVVVPEALRPYLGGLEVLSPR